MILSCRSLPVRFCEVPPFAGVTVVGETGEVPGCDEGQPLLRLRRQRAHSASPAWFLLSPPCATRCPIRLLADQRFGSRRLETSQCPSLGDRICAVSPALRDCAAVYKQKGQGRVRALIRNSPYDPLSSENEQDSAHGLPPLGRSRGKCVLVFTKKQPVPQK